MNSWNNLTIGRFVRRGYPRQNIDKYKGIIVRVMANLDGSAPCVEILSKDGKLNIDYFYCFEIDIEAEREMKINKILR
jgi:hypothetical protein